MDGSEVRLVLTRTTADAVVGVADVGVADDKEVTIARSDIARIDRRQFDGLRTAALTLIGLSLLRSLVKGVTSWGG